LTLSKVLDDSKGLTQSRDTVCLISSDNNEGQNTFKIEDITSSEVTLVDDLNKVAKILKEAEAFSVLPMVLTPKEEW